MANKDCSDAKELSQALKTPLNLKNIKTKQENDSTEYDKIKPENYLTECNEIKQENNSTKCDEIKLQENDSAESDEPPLVMQSSNLPIEDGLDIKHDGGGNGPSNSSNSDDNGDHEIVSDDDHDAVSGDEYFTDDEDDGPNDEVSEPPNKKLKNDCSDVNSTSKASHDSENSTDYKVSWENSTCIYSKENVDEESTGFGNEKILNAQISSNSMEFDILDEFESNDNDNDENYLSDSTDISMDEIDAMLEEGLQNGRRTSMSGTDAQQHEEKQKVILKVKGRDHFDLLPEGWIEVTHNSGMPVYLHKTTRVCSASKPYFLGPGSTRKHEVPISAIPCLHYLKEIEKEQNKKEQDETAADAVKDNLPSAKLESVKDTKESNSLSYLDVREYCKKRFQFQTITIKRFKTWCGRRMHQKQLRQKQRPTLPDSTKLITCPLPAVTDKNSTATSTTKREFIMNPSGKSPVCILHEYVQHTLRVQPKYIFKELENASTPYGAIVMISDIEYGSGYGSSKKQAKSEAAKAALDVLIPKMKIFAREAQHEEQDVAFFDEVRVEDPRVCELSVKAGQPYPYQILLECLKRNYGLGDTEISFQMHNLKHQKNEFLMKVGKHNVSVVCKNKRDGKHRASQAILQLLHPHIDSWGSLLRMYGKGSCKTLKEKKEEEQRITELQSQACANKPNMSILNKLREEMLKYREMRKNVKSIGKLIPQKMELSTSDSNLKNVEL